MLRVNFVLPPCVDKPIGGYKVVYQYANELVQRGYQVSISFTYRIYPIFNELIQQRLSRLKKYLISKDKRNKITWFSLDKRINLFFNVVTPGNYPDADFVIATSAPTSEIVAKLPNSKGEKFYFVQNFETWWFDNSVDRLNETFKLGLHNIVISNDLKEKVWHACGVEPDYLPNFYNKEEFNLVNPIENRQNIVSLLNHIQDTKRTAFGLSILKKVKKEVPSLEVKLFGAYEPVADLEDYVSFTYKASPKQLREEIFGKSKVYLLPSVLEGWGLTGMEAMASGTALVASEIGGIVDYANEKNSILIDPHDEDAYAQAIIYLLKNKHKQESIATEGYQSVQHFTLDKATSAFEKILISRSTK